MATSPKLIPILFLLAFFFIQIHAREFFSKIPRVNNNEKESTTVPDTREQEHETFIPENEKTSLPNREEETFGRQEQEPRFIPETRNGYGLYGHESGQFPPTTTTTTKETYEPYVTPVKYHADEPYNMIPEANNNNNKNTYYNNKNTYETEKQNLGEARFTERGWSTKENQNNNNNYYYGNNGYNNGERQGMSDTRFMANGRYFYDAKNENNYYPNQFKNSRGVASRNEYNENRYSNMGRYNQNQEEFEENEEEFEP
ncbi:protein E6-like [Herrania umbratica]|uniref:Protein E6-like n=1 Tax=Herrania umbratica TaxID=108875 RepID=A0A6J1B6V4_9ROSI|nr:protein E6-like [Herrania umbratica]